MQVKPQFFIGLVGTALALTACQKSSTDTGAPLSVLSNVQPTQLFIGKRVGDSAERCVYAVQINDAKQACQQNKCDVKVFHWPVQAIENGQRALLVTECTIGPQLNTGVLLSNKGPTGDSGILIFQQQREGDALWQSIELPNGDYAVELATEAAEGVLTYQQGRYGWQENPD